MTNQKPAGWLHSQRFQARRQFLRYLAGGALGAIAVSCLAPRQAQSTDPDLEMLCSSFPDNSRCVDYLPGARAVDSAGEPIQIDQVLTTAAGGDRILAKGLDRDAYLVISDGPEIAAYGLSAVCTHRGCTVRWDADAAQFACPCHGSQFDANGRVTRGPARRALRLITVVLRQDQIRLVQRSPAVDPRPTSQSRPPFISAGQIA